MMELRPYQSSAITALYDYFGESTGNPLVVMPTGTGKSVVIAGFVREAVESYPETRILMLTHVKELIAQNFQALIRMWPGAPAGIYSAGLSRRDIGAQILFAGIQSIHKHAARVQRCDIVIIDEAHLLGRTDTGMYRAFLNELNNVNAGLLKIVGFTATPYRMDSGMLHEGKDRLFSDIAYEVPVLRMIQEGYLSPVIPKQTTTQLDVSGVGTRGGEFIAGQLEAAVDREDVTRAAVAEIVQHGEGRGSWLVFCSGVAHARHVRDAIRGHGISAETVTGETPPGERDGILAAFKAGRLRCVTNANVLTTGFDAPGIDLIAMLRPTMSPGLYVQMAGRGLRIAPGKTDCLVLDFAGVVEQHGPITAVKPPSKKGDKVGEAPVKVCDHCQEICALSVRVCPACGEAFPEPVKAALKLHNHDIMGIEGTDLEVSAWTWRKHISRASGKEMLAVSYYGGLSDAPVTEYLAVTHDGYAGEKSRRLLADIAHKASVTLDYAAADLHEMAGQMTEGCPPNEIEFKKEGKFFTVLKRSWSK